MLTPKWMRGHVEVGEGVEDAPGGGKHVALVLVRRRARRPSCRTAGRRPRLRSTWARRQATARSASRSRRAAHSAGSPNMSALGQRVGARWPALDEVAGHGERRPGETDERHVELADEDPHRLEDVGGVGLGIERAEPVEVGGRAEGLGDDRAGAGDDVDAEADGGDRHHDVGVEDGGVDAVAPHGLQGELGGEVGLGDRVEDGAVASERPVLGQRAPGLAHEPDRHPSCGSLRQAARNGEPPRRAGAAWAAGAAGSWAPRRSPPRRPAPRQQRHQVDDARVGQAAQCGGPGLLGHRPAAAAVHPVGSHDRQVGLPSAGPPAQECPTHEWPSPPDRGSCRR